MQMEILVNTDTGTGVGGPSANPRLTTNIFVKKTNLKLIFYILYYLTQRHLALPYFIVIDLVSGLVSCHSFCAFYVCNNNNERSK